MLNNRLINTNANIPPIIPFDITLPDFTIITGLNGSGKTRLLSSIQTNQIIYQDHEGNDIRPDKIEIIRDPGNLIPFQGQNPADYSLNNFAKNRREVPTIMRLIDDYKKEVLKNHSTSKVPVINFIYSEFESFYTDLSSSLTDLNENPQLQNIIKRTNVLINTLRNEGFEIHNKDIPYLLVGNQLANQQIIPKINLAVPHSFALLQTFETWRVAHAKNEYQKYRVSIKKPNATALSRQEFENIYGPPPWDTLNQLLRNMGSKLQFHVNLDFLDEERTPFRELNLKDEKGTVFPAKDVSKGERIIFLIVLRRYAQSSDGFRYNNPKLLLLDELDAHLHPSLSGELLTLLQKSFVADGVKIIFATHSPSTIAHSDEGSLIVLRPYEEPKPSTRREALNILMSGQEKMFIDLSKARIVFVEDKSDVEIFEALTSTFIEEKTSKRLVFKSLSNKNAKGTSDGGKSRVKTIMDILGVEKNVIGLIDYDGKELEKDGMFVLCGNERYGIENLLLDPRILIYVVLRNDTHNWIKKFSLGISTISDFPNLQDTEIQGCIDIIEKIILGRISNQKKSITYMDGKKFDVASELLTMNCHDLDKLIETKLRLSKKLSTANYIKKIAREIIPEIKGSVPRSLKTTLNKLYR